MNTGLELLLGPGRDLFYSPSGASVELTLHKMSEQKKGWLTLSWSCTHFLTFTFSDRIEVELEMGSRDFHQKITSPISVNDALKIASEFMKQSDSWIKKYSWERLALSKIDFQKAPETIQGKLP